MANVCLVTLVSTLKDIFVIVFFSEHISWIMYTSISELCAFYIILAKLVKSKPLFLQVCDFGLSRLKHNTFLSSKSTAGTVRIWESLCYSVVHLFRHMQYVSDLHSLHSTDMILSMLAGMDGSWSSPQWTLKWEVSCYLFKVFLFLIFMSFHILFV